MGELTRIGLDLAKHVFQVHGVDAEGAVVLRKQLRRSQVVTFFNRLPRCVVGMEACATSNPVSQRLATIPRIGPIIATAIAGDCRGAERVPQRLIGFAKPAAGPNAIVIRRGDHP